MARSNAMMMAAVGSILGGMGVQEVARKSQTPTVQTTGSLATGGEFMNRTQVENLVDLTVSQAGWLSGMTHAIKSQRKGSLPRIELNEVVTEGVQENGGNTVSTHPDTTEPTYETKKFQATWFLTAEAIREARVSGDANFEDTVRRAFAKAMGNDMARWVLRGDTSLNNATRMNRLLRQRDGLLKKARASGNARTTTRGSAFHRSLFNALQSQLPDVFREDPNLRWFMPPSLDQAWNATLGDNSFTTGSALGDRATVERRRFEPLGIPQLLIPQMPVNQGFDTLNASAAAPDSAAASGGGIVFNVATVLGGVSANNVGRMVSVTHIATGEVETVRVTGSGASNVINTVGTLGQAVVSTSASDYLIDVADTAAVMLSNPANFYLVICDQIRAYRKFEQENERYRIDVFYEADCGIYNPNAMAIQDGVIVPQFTFGS